MLALKVNTLPWRNNQAIDFSSFYQKLNLHKWNTGIAVKIEFLQSDINDYLSAMLLYTRIKQTTREDTFLL